MATHDKEIMADLLLMSRRSGERADLVQAGGGNSSAKMDDGRMYVKASGMRLSDVTYDRGFALIDNIKLRSLTRETNWTALEKKAREAKAAGLVASCTITNSVRPSIETLLHSCLDGFVLHTHPVTVTAAFSGKNAQGRAAELLPDCALVDYETPGVDLALTMIRSDREFQERTGRRAAAYILRNHGLVTASPSAPGALETTDTICRGLEKALGLDRSDDRLCNRISAAMERSTGDAWITLLSTDPVSPMPSVTIPFFPDAVVFLGAGPLVLRSADDVERGAASYLAEHGLPPRMIRIGDRCFFTGSSMGKARESEEVWRLHAAAASFSPEPLSEEERRYLSHWEAEKYRQKI